MTDTMTAQTKSEALEASILHWQENVKAERSLDVLANDTDCALCAKFYDLECEGCPVYLRTGLRYCLGSPYGAAYAALREWRQFDAGAARDEFRRCAQAEVDFLISLRETE